MTLTATRSHVPLPPESAGATAGDPRQPGLGAAPSAYLRLAAPVHSWGSARASNAYVPTSPLPTYRGLVGLLAACAGVERPGADHPDYPEWIMACRFTVRTDEPGRIVETFNTRTFHPNEAFFRSRLAHAMSAGYDEKDPRAPSAGFKDGAEEKLFGQTEIVIREELHGASFLVRIDTDRLDRLVPVLTRPVFGPYLGRKTYPACAPFFMGVGPAHLLHEAPLLGTAGSARSAPSIHSVEEWGATRSRDGGAGSVCEVDKKGYLDWWADHATLTPPIT